MTFKLHPYHFYGAVVVALVVMSLLAVAGVFDAGHAHHLVHAVPVTDHVKVAGFGAHPPGAAPGVTYPQNIDLPQSSMIECSPSGCVTSVTP